MYVSESMHVGAAKVPVCRPELENGTLYRCPACGTQYAPWASANKYIQAQKILVLQPGEDIKTELGNFKAGEVSMFLMEWPDTSTTSLMNKLKEVCASVTEEFRAKSRREVLDHYRDIVNRTGQRSYFRPMVLSEDVKSQISWISSQGRN